MERTKDVLELAMLAGEILLASGAEIFRVQETVSRILTAYGVEEHHLYILSSGMLATANRTGKASHQALRHVPQQTINLSRIVQVNAISRQIVRQKGGDVAEMRQKLQACATLAPAPWWLMLLASGLGCGCFCYILGGSAADSVVAALAGLVMQLFLFGSNRLKVNPYIECILAAATGTLFCKIFMALGLGTSPGNAITGVIIALVPGVVITTGIRNFFTRDYLSGTIHIVDAVLTAVCIAVGVGCLLFMWNLVFGGVA